MVVENTPGLDYSERVNLDAYPVGMKESKPGEYKALVDQCRLDMKNNGVCILPNFVPDEFLKVVVSDSLGMRKSSHYSDNTHNVFLENDNVDKYPGDHPIHVEQSSKKNCISYDLVSEESSLRKLYEWKAMHNFLGDVLDKPEIFPTADELGGLNVHIYGEGDRLGWHFDRGEFAVTLLLQNPSGGGKFQYIRNLKNNDEESLSKLKRIITTDSPCDLKDEGVITLDIEAGTLVIFHGKSSLHRVTPVEGQEPRVLSVLSYETEENVTLNEYTRLKFFGRKYASEPVPIRE
eukprot:Nk52_evm95s224 gene=Nk52_evmTU95s224